MSKIRVIECTVFPDYMFGRETWFIKKSVEDEDGCRSEHLYKIFNGFTDKKVRITIEEIE
jgi:hypothetical protein